MLAVGCRQTGRAAVCLDQSRPGQDRQSDYTRLAPRVVATFGQLGRPAVPLKSNRQTADRSDIEGRFPALEPHDQSPASLTPGKSAVRVEMGVSLIVQTHGQGLSDAGVRLTPGEGSVGVYAASHQGEPAERGGAKKTPSALVDST
ncbi:hypothetical protein MU852_03535 [Brevundimonas albigilva]|nr:hypothetical protein [Brevundimonas albigilva]UQV18950.1 hypothetical protein MU852_03535 [Brevundimonas albigilva]